MALQLLKRNYTLQGWERPKILKLPQGEMRWAPRRLPVDVGDVMMNIRMDNNKTRYVNESVSKFSQGLNPYGEWGYPYKVNKNNIRPPIIDPKYYEPLSRMPVKFDSVTAGPIVRDLYGKQVEICKVAPSATIDRVCPDAAPRASAPGTYENLGVYREGQISLHRKQPHASIPYWPSIPVHQNTGVPNIELDPKMNVRPNMGIHFPYHGSDQSRDISNMRTPMHVALKPGVKDPHTAIYATPEAVTQIGDQVRVAAQTGVTDPYTISPMARTDIPLEPGVQIAAQPNLIAPAPTIDNMSRNTINLPPKVQTTAWYNPGYSLVNGVSWDRCPREDPTATMDKIKTAGVAQPGYSVLDMTEQQMAARPEDHTMNKIQTAASAQCNFKLVDNQGPDVPLTTRTSLNVASATNPRNYKQEGELGEVTLTDSLQLGEFSGKPQISTIQNHQEIAGTRVRPNNQQEYMFVGNGPTHRESFEVTPRPTTFFNHPQRMPGVKNKMQLQKPRVLRTALGTDAQKVSPIVSGGKFVATRV